MIKPQNAPQIVVRTLSSHAQTATLEYGALRYRCALGTSGKTIDKREGDGASPIGNWRLGTLYYRADRMPRPASRLPTRAISTTDGWCDDPADRNYNRLITHPYNASAEHIWRTDHIYDLVVTLDHNTRPRVRGRGSAIFIHVARDGYAPTEGCVALKRDHLQFLMTRVQPGTTIRI